jgi:hypothetical protein
MLILVAALVGALYAFIAVLRIRQWQRETAHRRQRAAMWQQLEACGYFRPTPTPPPAPARRQWFSPDGVEIFED